MQNNMMKMRPIKRLLLLASTTALISLQTACVSWPEHGQGGIAETQLDNYIPVEVEEEIHAEHGLRFDTESLRRQLDILVINGANYCFPATVVQAKNREARILRELHGGLYFDAANDILIQRELLARLERQLNYVLLQATCQPQGRHNDVLMANQQTGELSKILYDLLNSDNQFAEDSYQLNPKYVSRLAEAAVLLREHTQFNLHVIGHADFTGSQDYNQSLSLQRAEQVTRYLQIMGIASERIKVKGLGENLPLYEGTEDHIRLVNRRVTIELIESVTKETVQTHGTHVRMEKSL